MGLCLFFPIHFRSNSLFIFVFGVAQWAVSFSFDHFFALQGQHARAYGQPSRQHHRRRRGSEPARRRRNRLLDPEIGVGRQHDGRGAEHQAPGVQQRAPVRTGAAVASTAAAAAGLSIVPTCLEPLERSLYSVSGVRGAGLGSWYLVAVLCSDMVHTASTHTTEVFFKVCWHQHQHGGVLGTVFFFSNVFTIGWWCCCPPLPPPSSRRAHCHYNISQERDASTLAKTARDDTHPLMTLVPQYSGGYRLGETI